MPASISKQSVPFGTIVAFAGEPEDIPRGWLLCNGIEVRRLDYPLLFEAIGTAWGGSGGNTFFIPDLRGMFLRGVDNGRGVDPDVKDRTSPKIGEANPGNQRDHVGSQQPHAFESHSHTYVGDAGLGAEGFGGNAQLREIPVETNKTGASSETRPVNAYVNYIIKAIDV